MTWLLLGSDGQLGRCVQNVLIDRQISFVACNHNAIDITQEENVRDGVADAHPSAIINLAAWTDVDGAETQRSQAFLVNATGAENVARVAAESEIPLVHISTDYVFDGTKSSPYIVSDSTNPISVYGQSKLLGEQLVRKAHPGRSWVIRTAWLYSQHGKNFARTIAQRGLSGDPLSVVNDSFGQPTSALSLARQIVDLVRIEPPSGIYHGTNAGEASWFDFAEEILKAIPHHGSLTAVSSDLFPTIAKRPRYSVLDHSEWTSNSMRPMPHWKVSLAEILPLILSSLKD